MHYGNWPWREIQLVAKYPLVAETWNRWLKTFLAHHRDNAVPSTQVDRWLFTRYMDLSSKRRDSVHAVYAVKSFTGFRLWKSSCVCLCLLVSLSLSVSFCLCLSLFSLSLSLFVSVSFCFFLSLSLSVSVSLCLCLSLFSLSLSLFVSVSLCLSVSLFVSVSLSLSLCCCVVMNGCSHEHIVLINGLPYTSM